MHICVHYVICFIYVCIYTNGVIKTWRREFLLSFIMSEAATHTYAWIICLNARGITDPQMHPYTLTNSYRHMQASAHAHSVIHIYYNTYCCIQILLFFYCYLSQNLLSLCTPLQSRHFQILRNNF